MLANTDSSSQTKRNERYKSSFLLILLIYLVPSIGIKYLRILEELISEVITWNANWNDNSWVYWYISNIMIFCTFSIKKPRDRRVYSKSLLYTFLKELKLFKFFKSYLAILLEDLIHFYSNLFQIIFILSKFANESSSIARSCLSTSKEKCFELVYQILNWINIIFWFAAILLLLEFSIHNEIFD